MTTKGVMTEYRKHVSQMSNEEKELIEFKIANLNGFNPTKYCKSKMEERNITTEDIYNAILVGEPVEYHKKGNESRILFRSILNKQKKNICCVVRLSDGKVITCYKNDFNDEHDTLNYSLYDESIDIISDIC